MAAKSTLTLQLSRKEYAWFSRVLLDINILTRLCLQSPELEAILAPIRLAQEQSTYASYLSSSKVPHSDHKDPFDLRTTSNWDFRTASHPRTTVKQEWEAVRREISAIANVLASMAAVSTAVWWVAGTTPLAQVRPSILLVFLIAY